MGTYVYGASSYKVVFSKAVFSCLLVSDLRLILPSKLFPEEAWMHQQDIQKEDYGLGIKMLCGACYVSLIDFGHLFV